VSGWRRWPVVSILAALSAPERKDLLVRVVDAVAGAPRPLCVAVVVFFYVCIALAIWKTERDRRNK
jgi:hypothetical protein